MKHNYFDNGVEVQPFYPTNVKLTKSGMLLEIGIFGRDIFLGMSHKRKEVLDDLNAPPKPKASHDDIVKATARRAKKNIKQLVNANAFLWFRPDGKYYKPTILTLTFEENIQDLKTANYEFTKFIRRLNYEMNKIEGRDVKISNLKYLGVFELQKRGAIHYHLIFFNLPSFKDSFNILRNIWGQGRIRVGDKRGNFVKVKNQKQLRKIIDYFTKYIQKSILENNLKNQKKYITSRDLLKPIKQYSPEVVHAIREKLNDDLLTYLYDGEQEVLNGAPRLPYIGWMKYLQYDLSDNPKLNNEINRILASYSFDTEGVTEPLKPIDEFDISKATKIGYDDFFNLKIQTPFPDL